MAVAVLIQAAGICVIPGYDRKTLFAIGVGLVAALVLCLRAVARRRRGAYLAGTGVAICCALMVTTLPQFLDVTVFYGYGFLLACLLVTQALQVRDERRALAAARLNAVRLELELLKRYLQPHFLLNTLTALAELFEDSPEDAGPALEALAQELRTLGSVASQRLISVEQEVELCRSHLRMMSIRRDQHFRLRLEGVDLCQEVPPALFHTLVENVLTHNRYQAPEIELCLRQMPAETGRHYRFEAPLGEDPVREGPQSISLGTGQRYIEARLSESFGDAWTLSSRAVDGAWRTDITIEEEDRETG